MSIKELDKLLAERDRLVFDIHRLWATIHSENAKIHRKKQEIERLKFWMYLMSVQGISSERPGEYRELERKVEELEKDYNAEIEKLRQMNSQLIQLAGQLNGVVSEIQRIRATQSTGR